MKKCAKCALQLPFDCFHKNKKNTDGFQNYCKACRIAARCHRTLDQIAAESEARKAYRATSKPHKKYAMSIAKRNAINRKSQRFRDYANDLKKRQVQTVSDWYARELLLRNMPAGALIPPALIHAKKLTLKIKRLLKKANQ